jgi:predicted transcriptional regulator
MTIKRLIPAKQPSQTVVEQKPITPVRILERWQPETMTFERKEDFQKYLSEHLEELNALSTNKLNRMIRIPGYRITKLLNAEKTKQEISLKTDRYVTQEKKETKEEKLTDMIKALDSKFEFIVEVLKEKGILDEVEEELIKPVMEETLA